MIVVYYGLSNVDVEELQDMVNYIKETTTKDVLAVPKDFDLILEPSRDQLLSIRNMIDKALEEKEKVMNTKDEWKKYKHKVVSNDANLCPEKFGCTCSNCGEGLFTRIYTLSDEASDDMVYKFKCTRCGEPFFLIGR